MGQEALVMSKSDRFHVGQEAVVMSTSDRFHVGQEAFSCGSRSGGNVYK